MHAADADCPDSPSASNEPHSPDDRYSFSALAASILDPVVIWSPLRDDTGLIVDFVYDYVNPAAEQTIGVPANQLLGQRLLEVLPAHRELGLFDRYLMVATTGVSDVIEIPWFEDGDVAGAFEASVSRIGNDIMSVARNVSDRVLTEHRLQASERRGQMLLDHANDVIVHVVDGRVEWVSPAVETLLGVTPVSMIGTRASAWCHPATVHLLDRIAEPDRENQAGDPRPTRGRLRRGDGGWCDVETRVSPVVEADSSLESFVAVVRDIGDELDARDGARRAEGRLHKVLDSVFDGVVVIGTDGLNKFSNAANLQLLGYTADELAEMVTSQWIHPDEFDRTLEHLAATESAPDRTVSFESRVVDRDGRVIPVDITIANMDDDPAVEGVVVTIRDLTAQHDAASQLAESEARHRHLMSAVPDAVIVVEDGLFEYGNDAAAALCGVASTADLVGLSLSDFQSPEVTRASMEFGRHFLETGTFDEPLVGWMHRLDGSPVKIEATPATVPGNRRAMLLVLRDITEQDRLITELADSEATGRFITENSTNVILRADDDRRIVFATPAISALLEITCDDVIGLHIPDLFDADDRDDVVDSLRRAAETGSAEPLEARARTAASGSIVWVEVAVRAVPFVTDHTLGHEYHVTLRDITEQRNARITLADRERWLHTLVNGAPIGIFELDPIGNCTFVNATYCSMLGVAGLADVEGMEWTSFIHPDDAGQLGVAWQAARGTLLPYEMTIRFVRRDGLNVQAQIGVAPVVDDRGAITSWLGTIDDITERVELERTSREASSLFVAAFEHAPAGLTIMGVDQFPPRLIRANEAQLRLTGLTSAELAAIDFYDSTHPEDVNAAASGRAALLAGEIDSHQMEVRQKFRPDHDWRWFSLVRSVVRDSDGTPTHLLAQSTDVTERKEAEQRQYRLAVTDELTGLANRRHFEDRLVNTHSRLLRTALSIGVIFIDLDHFKQVNDNLGHSAGDDVLKEVAEILLESVRPGDTVARFGGDEFAVLAEHERDADIRDMADRLRVSIDIPVELPSGTIMHVTSSIGVAAQRAQHTSPVELVKRADEAMYLAKQQGRHTWTMAQMT